MSASEVELFDCEDYEEIDLGLEYFTGIRSNGSVEVLAFIQGSPNDWDMEEILAETREYSRDMLDSSPDSYSVVIEENEDSDGYRSGYREMLQMSEDEVRWLQE